MLEHIPKILEGQVKGQFDIVRQQINAGQLQEWLNKELENLHEKNPVLFHYIVERTKKFAMGAMMVGDPNSVSISLALEYVILLNILNTGIGSTAGLKQFGDMMKGWLKGDELDGYNEVGKEKK